MQLKTIVKMCLFFLFPAHVRPEDLQEDDAIKQEPTPPSYDAVLVVEKSKIDDDDDDKQPISVEVVVTEKSEDEQ